jgi:putative inorganic carbon (HCO3(-)) transporter
VYRVLLALIFWLPLPVGSARDLGAGFMLVASFGLLLFWSLKVLINGSGPSHVVRHTQLVIAVFMASALYQFFQLAPLPPTLGTTISNLAQAAYTQVPNADSGAWTPISVDAGSTLEEALKSCAYITLFFMTLTLIDTHAKLKTAMWVMVATGFAQALAGLTDSFYNGELFGNALRAPSQGASGTYANRNHFAGLLEMCIPYCAALLVAIPRRSADAGPPTLSTKAVLRGLMNQQILPYLMLATMIAGLLFSTSRGGILSLALASMAVILWSRLQVKKNALSAASLSAIGVAVALAVTLGAQPIIKRLESQGFFDNERQLYRELAYRVFADFPGFGSGAGTWTQVYPAYQAVETYSPALINYVHNDYLELLVEQGLIGFGLFGLAVLLVVAAILRGLQEQQDPIRRAALYGSLTAALSILIHSLVDFNLHIPANAAIFSVVMALGLIAARMPSRTDSSG